MPCPSVTLPRPMPWVPLTEKQLPGPPDDTFIGGALKGIGVPGPPTLPSLGLLQSSLPQGLVSLVLFICARLPGAHGIIGLQGV